MATLGDLVTHSTEHLAADDQTEFSDLGDSLAEWALLNSPAPITVLTVRCRTDYTSLSSTILDHVYENGRRYHSLNAGKYTVPNDEVSSWPVCTRRGISCLIAMQNEQERLDMVHHAISLMLDGALHVVDIPKKLNRILDCGTGTGIWAIDMAEYSAAQEVHGAIEYLTEAAASTLRQRSLGSTSALSNQSGPWPQTISPRLH